MGGIVGGHERCRVAGEVKPERPVSLQSRICKPGEHGARRLERPRAVAIPNRILVANLGPNHAVQLGQRGQRVLSGCGAEAADLVFRDAPLRPGTPLQKQLQVLQHLGRVARLSHGELISACNSAPSPRRFSILLKYVSKSSPSTTTADPSVADRVHRPTAWTTRVRMRSAMRRPAAMRDVRNRSWRLAAPGRPRTISSSGAVSLTRTALSTMHVGL